jgi:predicted MFS family arabinose efflux permease
MTTSRRPFSAPVWHNRNFVLLWSGQAFSQFGAYASSVVVPLLAIETLHAGSSELGVLGLMRQLPLALYIVAGVWVDRVRKRRTMIGATLIRSALLLLIPLEAALGILSVALLGVTLFSSAVLAVWFDTAYRSYLPSLVDREHLVEGNSRIESARATAQLTGPGIGGLLVQAVTAPVAVILDGLSLLGSALMVARIRHQEPKPESGPRGVRGVWTDLLEGLRFLGRDPVLRPLVVAIAICNFAWAAEGTLYVIYLVTVLGLPAALVGVTLVGAGVGAVVGALAAPRVARRIGLSGAIMAGLTVFAIGTLLIPLSPPVVGLATPMLVLAGFVMSVGGQVCSVNMLSLRQGITPEHLQGRVNGSFWFLSYGLAPVGALAGGLAGTLVGARIALFVTVAMMAVGPLVVRWSAAGRLRELPAGQTNPRKEPVR